VQARERGGGVEHVAVRHDGVRIRLSRPTW
jgi:hypothetical protein